LSVSVVGYFVEKTRLRDVVRLEVLVTNVGAEPVVIYDGPPVPSVLHGPPGYADVLFGLRPRPVHVHYEGAESLQWSVLPPGQSHRCDFRISNPLEEKGPYGNPFYQDRKSAYFGLKPDVLLWDSIKIEVAYIMYDSAVDARLRGVRYLNWHIALEKEGRYFGLLDLQRAVSVKLVRTGH
jgi:hypothetical protein